MDTAERVAILGAGAWGLSLAVALGEAGLRPTVYEQAEPGSGATGLAGGLLSTHLRQASDILLVEETKKRLSAIQAWGRDAEIPSADHAFQPVGGLTLLRAADEPKLASLHDRLRAAGVRAQQLNASDIRSRWPLQNVDGLVGLFTPTDGQTEPGDVGDLLARRAKHLGASVKTGTPAVPALEGGNVSGVAVNGNPTRFDRVVVAAGAWSKGLLAGVGLRVPIKPYRTQIAQVELAPPPAFPILHDTDQFVYARSDGANRMLAGDGTELTESSPDTFNRNPDPGFVEKIARALTHRWKDGHAAGFRKGWAGLCVATPDRDPLIGPYPGVAGLHLMTGDNGFGLMRSLALGRIAADGLRTGRWAAAYDPARLDFEADFPIREGFEL